MAGEAGEGCCAGVARLQPSAIKMASKKEPTFPVAKCRSPRENGGRIDVVWLIGRFKCIVPFTLSQSGEASNAKWAEGGFVPPEGDL